MSDTILVYKEGQEPQPCLATALPYALRNGYRLWLPPDEIPASQAAEGSGGAHAAATSGSSPEPATSADNSSAIVIPEKRGPGRPRKNPLPEL